jgi:hypothetical protein
MLLVEDNFNMTNELFNNIFVSFLKNDGQNRFNQRPIGVIKEIAANKNRPKYIK